MMVGRTELTDIELVALVLGGGHATRRAFMMLDAFGGVAGLDRANSSELCTVPGVGVAGATAVCAGLELGRRAQMTELRPSHPIVGPQDLAGFVRAAVGAGEVERFGVVGLDARQHVRTVQIVAVGTLSQVEVHPREVFRPLIRCGVHSCIVFHNHPSGDPQPSEADLELTRRLADAGRLVGIPLLDHLVVTRTRYLSLAQLGWLPGV